MKGKQRKGKGFGNGLVIETKMIKQVTMFRLLCDNCGADVNEGQEYSCWNDKDYAKDVAMQANWIKEGDKHYCPKCFSYADNGLQLPAEGDFNK